MNLPCNECDQPCCRLTGTRHNWRALGADCAVAADGACEHLSADGKCSIYGKHPANCKHWRCDTDARFLEQHPQVAVLLKTTI